LALMPVTEALARVLDQAAPVPAEEVSLVDAAGRVLARPLHALRTQPPLDVSAMDGYAVRAADVVTPPVRLHVIGEAAAGRPFARAIGPGEALRIFTGGAVPDGADTILIQENAYVLADGLIEVREAVPAGRHIRKAGLDFRAGDLLLEEGRILDPAALALAAAANHPRLPVVARPVVAILATGDELLPPGCEPGAGQIIASNSFGIAALCRMHGADAMDLGIATDDRAIIAASIAQAFTRNADVIVTLGGASVGDHDLVQDALADIGAEMNFWKVAMRPGKPMMFARHRGVRILGLPGNPVSSLVCAHLFLKPLLRRLAGLPEAEDTLEAALGADMPENDHRQDHVRARLVRQEDRLVAIPFPLQDSSMLRILAQAHCLIIRPPFAPPASAGEICRVIRLR
jgi:molybdopterin molybdotransferase